MAVSNPLAWMATMRPARVRAIRSVSLPAQQVGQSRQPHTQVNESSDVDLPRVREVWRRTPGWLTAAMSACQYPLQS
jgi:hypothetical protein